MSTEANETSAPKWTPSEAQVREVAELIAAALLPGVEVSMRGGLGILARDVARTVWAESPGPALYEALEELVARLEEDDRIHMGILRPGLRALALVRGNS